MNTNSNTYTVIYSVILVVVVAVVLAFTAMTLQQAQETNVKVETISKILTSAGLYDAESGMTNDQILKAYGDNIKEAVLVNAEGQVTGSLETVLGQSDLKLQTTYIKKASEGDADAKAKIALPVYIFNIDGQDVPVVPCYGAGLWGPIWGYLAFEGDMNTIEGAVFDHKGETPGLGAEIATNWFRNNFTGKKIYNAEGEFTSVKVVKGGAAEDDINGVDAISGGTITSQALEKAIKSWLEAYVPYFETLKAVEE